MAKRRRLLTNEDLRAKFGTKKTIQEDSKTSVKGTGLSNIQKLYLAGGVLDTFAITVGTLSAASAIRFKGKFQEAGFIENARRLKLAAKDAIKRGDKSAANYLKSIRKFEGSQVAAMAAQGIDVSRGTAADIRAETIETGIEDTRTIRVNALREAYGFEVQAIEQRSAARIGRIGRKLEERQRRLLGISQVAQSTLGTVSSIQKAGTAGTTTTTTGIK